MKLFYNQSCLKVWGQARIELTTPGSAMNSRHLDQQLPYGLATLCTMGPIKDNSNTFHMYVFSLAGSTWMTKHVTLSTPDKDI